MQQYCFFNGTIMPVEDAHVSVYDIGIIRGYGIYEALQTYHKKPLFLKEHLDRLRASSKALHIEIPYSDAELESAILQLVERNGHAETNIRILLTGGRAIHSIDFDPKAPTFYILADRHEPIDSALYEQGCKVITFEHQRLYPQFKTTNYMTAVNLQKEKKEKGALEIIYHHDGKVLEAATSNFFMVEGDTIVTAKRDVLPGITRMKVLDAISGKFKVDVRDVLIQEFNDATEAFLTGSYKDVLPVVQIDDKQVGDGKVGKYTKEIMALFKDYMDRQVGMSS